MNERTANRGVGVASEADRECVGERMAQSTAGTLPAPTRHVPEAALSRRNGWLQCRNDLSGSSVPTIGGEGRAIVDCVIL